MNYSSSASEPAGGPGSELTLETLLELYRRLKEIVKPLYYGVAPLPGGRILLVNETEWSHPYIVVESVDQAQRVAALINAVAVPLSEAPVKFPGPTLDERLVESSRSFDEVWRKIHDPEKSIRNYFRRFTPRRTTDTIDHDNRNAPTEQDGSTDGE